MRSAGWEVVRSRAADVWPLLQGAAAATTAWLLAQRLPLPHGHDPLFAPIAAFVALNAPLGERGVNAIRLVAGVIAGIVAGELAVATLPSGHGLSIAVAIIAGTVVARACGGTPIVVAQAASAAIITVAVADDQAGITRLVDALVGASVALVFSQLLFAPEPVRLVRRAETAALSDLTKGLELAAEALDRDDDGLGARALTRLRDMRDALARLGRAQRAGTGVARRSAVWQRQREPVVEESENAAHLDLLAGSCLMVVRTAMATSTDGRRRLAPSVRRLADAVDDLVDGLDDRDVRQQSADGALAAARHLAAIEPPADPTLDQAVATIRTAAADIMTFAGVDEEQAVAAVREGTRRLKVPEPPQAPRLAQHARPWSRRLASLASLGAAAYGALRRRVR